MSNPGFQEYFLPILNYLKGKEEINRNVIMNELVTIMKLSDDDKRETIPSGTEPVYQNRMSWALTYLKKAGLVDAPFRSHWKITNEGLKILEKNPQRINLNFLKKLDTFIDVRNAKDDLTTNHQTNNEETMTPMDSLIQNYETIKRNICDEMLQKILNQTPDFFERLVVELLVKMGYGGSVKDAGKALGKSGDEGIDGIIKEDKLGLDNIYIQAKKWQPGNSIGRPEIQKFIGALSGQSARKGIFITTSSFTSEALSYKSYKDISLVLIDGKQLLEYMYEYGVGVTEDQKLEIKKIDIDFFE
jgi:restriction system protein